MYLLKSVPAQFHCSKHVEVFFDNLSTIYEEYSSPKSVWQKHLKYHIRLFLPALYILKVIFSTFKSDPSYHSTHTMSLICHASLNAFCLQIHTWLQWPTITPCYNSIQQTPHYWTSLYFYSTMEYLHTVKLYWKKRIPENIALPECCALTA